jgi:predicted CxxxxCH...CXXCH cytochrome family protein
MRTTFSTLGLALALAATSACDRVRPVEGAAHDCTACHGGLHDASGAPPRDLRGRDADAPGEPPRIGAHEAHVRAGVACESCHVVPARASDPAHVDGTPGAEVTFGAAARAGGAQPQYAGGTCSGVYCHGATLDAGGSAVAPAWGEQLSGCGTCHASPPPSHGAASDCSLCHGASVADDDTSLVTGGGHLNGSLDLDVTNACTTCHGDASRVTSRPLDRAAPDTAAHLAHLLGGDLSGGFACAECHAVPTDLAHADAPPAEVVFHGPLGNQGATPSYAGGSCSSVYCHGATLLGGTDKAPDWTGAGQDACGTCHGRPPPAPHPQQDRGGAPITTNVQCSDCHPGTVLGPAAPTPGAIDVANGLHVNGTKDVDYHAGGWSSPALHGRAANFDDAAWPGGIGTCRACHGTALDGGLVAVSCDACHTSGTAAWRTTCTFCHGDANRATNAPAPPAGSASTEISTTDRAVGAHQKHLGSGSTISNGVACTECHATPAGIDHVDGTARLTWGPLATSGGAAPAWDGTTCASTYCHGATLPGTGRASPIWAPPTTLSCGSCHQLAPTTGRHPATFDKHRSYVCGTCHGGTYAGGLGGGTAADTGLHVNGLLDKAADLQWRESDRSCDPACHGRKNW